VAAHTEAQGPCFDDKPPNKRIQQTALGFKRKVIAFMRWDESSNGLHLLARRLITPQLMRRAVRRRIRRL
jgi:hypothetical protein